jgi:hypothetical protein
MNKETLNRLHGLSKEPVRAPMSRGVQFPSMAVQHIVMEQEINTLRSALAEAVAAIIALQAEQPRPSVGGEIPC